MRCRGWKFKIFLLKIKIFILYLQFLFTYPFSLLIIHWIMISWWKFKLSVTDTLQIFLLMTSNWMILLSDETLTRKGKKLRKIILWFFWFFTGKFTQKFFIENFMGTGREFLFLFSECNIIIHDLRKFLTEHSRWKKFQSHLGHYEAHFFTKILLFSIILITKTNHKYYLNVIWIG